MGICVSTGAGPADKVRADKAYSSRAIRQHLRGRGIVAVIPRTLGSARPSETPRLQRCRPVGCEVEDYSEHLHALLAAEAAIG